MKLASWLRSFTNMSRQPSRPSAVAAERHRGRSLQKRHRGLERLEDRALLSAGQLDPTFGQAGIVSTNIGGPTSTVAKAVVVTQTDGKVVVVGQNNDVDAGGDKIDVLRYNTDGTLDNTFGSQGEVVFNFNSGNSPVGVALDASGRIVVAGSTHIERSAVRRRSTQCRR